MKNSVKIALGVAAGGILVYLNQRRKNQKNQENTFTAPDGNSYKKDQIYLTAQGETFKNGKKIRLETPENTSQHHNHIDANFNNQPLHENYEIPQQEISYHQKGDRHR